MEIAVKKLIALALLACPRWRRRGRIVAAVAQAGARLRHPKLLNSFLFRSPSCASFSPSLSEPTVRLDMSDERPGRQDKVPVRSAGLRQLPQPCCEVGEKAAVITRSELSWPIGL